ncbi:MAG: AmmeMemoRadiSam system radical SAM enzyme [Candidatus Brockarchaeota archaeon]|nr:AmmeMemoRadiSam system radical SAM enzyme [Candidatus Brockarchaeota archaeon]
MVKEAVLWHKEDDKIRCDLCGRRCLISDRALGACLVRKAIDGKLYSLNYGKLIALHVDPIEKKPLFHFLPGNFTFSIASAGCNFSCRFCCNYDISQVYRDRRLEHVVGDKYSPEDVVNQALSEGCRIISYTYTEPTIFFEFAYDTAKLAHERGIKNTFVTNGYMTPEAVRMIAPYLDAATVDFKCSGDPECYRKIIGVPDVKPIYDCLMEMKKQGVFIEITNLVIPGFDDDMSGFRGLVKWIRDNLGDETPLHILRFFPTYRFSDIPDTPLESLRKAYESARQEGMKFVYLGNVPGQGENTYCPSCGELLIERFGLMMSRSRLKEDKCPRCGTRIPIVT